jgi:hypothetical protein
VSIIITINIMSELQEQILTQTIQGFGYPDVMSFAREQALQRIREQIVHYQSRVRFFEEKYGMNYEEFCAKFHEIATPSLFEREDDSMEWDTALDVIGEYERDARLLS